MVKQIKKKGEVMSVWCSIDGTNALHYAGSHLDPREAKEIKGPFMNESADLVDLAIVPKYVFDNNAKNGYLPYLRLGVHVSSSGVGSSAVILNREQVKKLKRQLKQFLRDTKRN